MALGGRTVTAPDGTTWHVARQWWPRKLRFRGRRRRGTGDGDGWLSGLDLGGGADDVLGLLVAIFVIIVVVALLFMVVFPLLVLGVELILVLLLFFWGVTARLVLRRPWTIRARAGERELHWQATGFRRSGRVRDEASAALARGEAQPHPPEALPA
jgi:hypothetical protein